MTGQNDRQDRSLTGQVHDQAGHCPLTGRYLQPCKKTREGHNLQPIYLFQLRDNTVLFDNFVTKRNLCNYCLACKQAHLCKFQESQHLCGCYDAPPL